VCCEAIHSIEFFFFFFLDQIVSSLFPSSSPASVLQHHVLKEFLPLCLHLFFFFLASSLASWLQKMKKNEEKNEKIKIF